MTEEIALHVDERGAGPAVLLHHGFAGSARNFGPQARALAPQHRVILYDARGHARSAAPREAAAYRMEAFVADLGRVLDGAGVERAVVGGLSLGAAVALRFAQERPGRARGLVLASFPPGRAPGEAVSGRALAFAEAIEKEGMEAAGARFVWGPESGLDPRGAALVRQGFLEHPPHALAHVLRELLAVLPPLGEQAATLASVAAPVLLVAGSDDAASVAAARSLAAARPDAEVDVIEGAGHVVNLARPDAFNARLLAFLASLA